MQAIGETVFEVVYLILVVTLGIGILRRSGGERQYRLFGWAAVLLGAGDSFHLVPRMIALWTAGLDAFSFWLGLGKLVTSVTMTVFYVLLFFVWRERYGGGKHCAGLTRLALVLAALRVLLCAMPQNRWLTNDGPLGAGKVRPVPSALAGGDAELCVLPPGRTVRGRGSGTRDADDSEDLRLRLGGFYGREGEPHTAGCCAALTPGARTGRTVGSAGFSRAKASLWAAGCVRNLAPDSISAFDGGGEAVFDETAGLVK